jgi:hypothetical protein
MVVMYHCVNSTALLQIVGEFDWQRVSYKVCIGICFVLLRSTRLSIHEIVHLFNDLNHCVAMQDYADELQDLPEDEKERFKVLHQLCV